jgi:hypothetical protein
MYFSNWRKLHLGIRILTHFYGLHLCRHKYTRLCTFYHIYSHLNLYEAISVYRYIHPHYKKPQPQRNFRNADHLASSFIRLKTQQALSAPLSNTYWHIPQNLWHKETPSLSSHDGIRTRHHFCKTSFWQYLGSAQIMVMSSDFKLNFR